MEFWDISLEELLAARENRAARQKMLLSQYGCTLICYTMNIPGPRKCSPEIIRGFRLGQELLLSQLQGEGVSVFHREEHISPTGCEGYYLVEENPETVKGLMAQVEDAYPWTRLLDLDVIAPPGTKLSREELGLPPRKCLLCENKAAVCARSRAHGLQALQEETDNLLRDAIREADSRFCGEMAAKALLYEVCAAPKPGLVDRLGQGSHKDMDLFTFLSSTAALQPYFSQCAAVGMETTELLPEETFSRLRLVGKEAEHAMLRATKGINTHKGAIFTLGLLCGALGRLPRAQWKETDKVLSLCAQMTKGLTNRELETSRATGKDTPGKAAYRLCGSKGARGQAELGFPAILGAGLPVLKASLALGNSPEEASCHALLHLIPACGDTNLIARGGLSGQKEMVSRLQALLDTTPFPSKAQLEELDREFVEKNLSPGGSADLLAASWFLLFLSSEKGQCP